VTAFNASGSALIYSTYLGLDSEGLGIAVDSLGDAYVAGDTSSATFPTLNAVQPSYHGNFDAFLTVLNPRGSALVSSTYFGGSGAEFAYGIALDSFNNAYLTGSTNSLDFPTYNAYPADSFKHNGSEDIFVVKISPVTVSFGGLPQQPFSRDSRGNFVALVALTNSSNSTIPVLQVTVSGTTLGSGSLLAAPPAISNFAPGTSVQLTLTFPPTSVSAGTTSAPLKVSGTYSVPSIPLNGNWSLSFRSVRLK
jgi:hypothetical protein